MPSPRRYVRFIAGLAIFLIVVVLYTRRAQVEQYRDYVTEHVVGGGAVLREKTEDKQAPLRPAQDDSAPATTTRPAEPFVAAPAAPTTTISMADGFGDMYNEVTSTLSLVQSTTTAIKSTSILAQTLPPTVPGEKYGHDVPPGHVPPPSTSEEIHWSQQPEHFPISSTIQLPTGTPKPFPRIQYTGRDAGKADKERLAIIKQAAAHAWYGYMDHAWGMDEVKPISGGFKNPFNGWAATLVDSMDTLWIMGMVPDFEDAVEFVSELDFTISLLPDIPLFETTIRYLGGLLGAYDVSGAKYQILLDKAVELAEVLYSAFDTPNRMPQLYYRWRPAFASQPHRASTRVVMAELGSLSLEFTRLAQLTGEPKYYDAIARITDAFQEFQNHTRLPGMWPTTVDASGCGKPAQIAPVVPGSMVHPPPVALPHDLGTGAVLGPPMSQNADEFSVKPKLTPADRKAQIDAQGQLNEALPNGVPNESGGQSDRLTGSDSNRKPNIQSASQLGSSKVKRQLGYMNSSLTQDGMGDASAKAVVLDETIHKEELRGVPPSIAADTLTGQDVCTPQGLASLGSYRSDVFSLGGQSDSTYEYLPKQYILLGGRVTQYKDMYVAAANAVIQNILFRPMTEDNADILVSGSMHVSINSSNDEYIYELTTEGEHLTCFAGGMFAMAGKIFNRPGDVQIGRKLAEGCVWAYNVTNSGIMPEIFQAIECEDWGHCVWNKTKYWRMLDPNEEFRTKVYDPQPASTILQTQSTASTTSIGRNEGIAMSTSSLSTASIAMPTIDATIPEERWVDNKIKMASSPDDVVKEWISENPDAEALGSTFDRWVDDVASTNSKPDLPSGPLDKRQLEQPDSPTVKAKAKANAALDVALAARPTTTRTPTAAATDPATPVIDDSPIWTPKPPLSHAEFVQQKIADERLPPGIVRIKDRRYILRPEAIESVFYLYRITGEQHWRDVGWQMFTSIVSATKAEFGHAAIDDVTKTAPEQRDSMESFWLAETLKYFYLLFEDAEKWSLDEWVLNTEAHFFRRPEVEFLD